MKIAVSRSRVIVLVAVVGLVVVLFARPEVFLPPLLTGASLPELSLYRVEFVPGEIVVHVMNTGPVDVDVAGVQVGGSHPFSIRDFVIEPDSHLARLGTAVIRIPYNWIPAEPYAIKIIGADGVSFTTSVEAAVPSPSLSGGFIGTAVLLGLYVGVIPVYLGMAPFNLFRRMSQKSIGFLVAFTAGVLLFLFIDTMKEGAEIALRLPLHLGPTIFVVGLVGGVMGLVLLARLTFREQPSVLESNPGTGGLGVPPLYLGYMIALAIGLHNVGEGLGIGAAFTQGLFALANLLVIGFAISNLPEGIAIMTPVVSEKAPGLRMHLLAMGAVAGVPTIAGTLLGFTFYSDLIAALFFALASAAILYIVGEVLTLIAAAPGASNNPYNYAGLLAGIFVMYATSVMLTVLAGGA